MIPKLTGNDVIYDNTLPVDYVDDVMPRECALTALADRRGTQTLSRRARRFRDTHARLSLPPVNGRGTPVVPGRLSGRLFTDRMAR